MFGGTICTNLVAVIIGVAGIRSTSARTKVVPVPPRQYPHQQTVFANISAIAASKSKAYHSKLMVMEDLHVLD